MFILLAEGLFMGNINGFVNGFSLVPLFEIDIDLCTQEENKHTDIQP